KRSLNEALASGARLRAYGRTPRGCKPRREHLVDAPPVHIDHLETPAIGIDAFAGGWQTSEMGQDKSGHSLVVAPFGERDGQEIGHLVGRQITREQPRAI